jgi:hypothetical protein
MLNNKCSIEPIKAELKNEIISELANGGLCQVINIFE